MLMGFLTALACAGCAGSVQTREPAISDGELRELVLSSKGTLFKDPRPSGTLVLDMLTLVETAILASVFQQTQEMDLVAIRAFKSTSPFGIVVNCNICGIKISATSAITLRPLLN